MATRKFKKVPKKKSGVHKSYIKGSKNTKAREREINITKKLYKAGKITPAMMNRISKQRSKS